MRLSARRLSPSIPCQPSAADSSRSPRIDFTGYRKIASTCPTSRLSTRWTAWNAIMQLNQTIVEALDGFQIERHMLVTTRNQRNAIADEDRHYADHELVDRPLVEKRGNEITAAHQPDVLAWLLAKLTHIGSDRIAYELDGAWHIGGRCATPEKEHLTG